MDPVQGDYGTYCGRNEVGHIIHRRKLLSNIQCKEWGGGKKINKFMVCGKNWTFWGNVEKFKDKF